MTTDESPPLCYRHEDLLLMMTTEEIVEDANQHSPPTTMEEEEEEIPKVTPRTRKRMIDESTMEREVAPEAATRRKLLERRPASLGAIMQDLLLLGLQEKTAPPVHHQRRNLLQCLRSSSHSQMVPETPFFSCCPSCKMAFYCSRECSGSVIKLTRTRGDSRSLLLQGTQRLSDL